MNNNQASPAREAVTTREESQGSGTSRKSVVSVVATTPETVLEDVGPSHEPGQFPAAS